MDLGFYILLFDRLLRFCSWSGIEGWLTLLKVVFCGRLDWEDWGILLSDWFYALKNLISLLLLFFVGETFLGGGSGGVNWFWAIF